MLASPSTFYRGAAFIMAADLAPTPRSGFEVQLCGDAHLLNFGVYASPERQMLFDINDFDETLPGPWEWDVKRLAASFEVAGRDLGFAPGDRRDIVLAGVREFREAMSRAGGRCRAIDAWYARLSVEDIRAWIAAEVRAGRLGRERPGRLGPTSPRRARASTSAPSGGWPAKSTARSASSPTRRSSCRSTISCLPARLEETEAGCVR